MIVLDGLPKLLVVLELSPVITLGTLKLKKRCTDEVQPNGKQLGIGTSLLFRVNL